MEWGRFSKKEKEKKTAKNWVSIEMPRNEKRKDADSLSWRIIYVNMKNCLGTNPRTVNALWECAAAIFFGRAYRTLDTYLLRWLIILSSYRSMIEILRNLKINEIWEKNVSNQICKGKRIENWKCCEPAKEYEYKYNA